MQTALFRTAHLTTYPHNTDDVISGPAQPVGGGSRLKFLDHVPGWSTTTNENKSKSSWKSTAYASAKVVIDVVKESSDVFPPLKSVVGGLAAILKHCDVWSVSLVHTWC